MHVAVIGTGGIGTVLAAASSATGHDVTVCARTPIDHMVIERDGQDRTLAVRIVTDPTASEVTPADVVWVTTKAADTPGAAPWLDRLLGPRTLVAVAQNGLDHQARLAPFVREGQLVVPALAYIAAERVAPGRVVHLSGHRIVVPAGEPRARLAEAVETETPGGLTVNGEEDMHTAAWRKLLGNLVANPITALTMRRIGVMHDPGIADLSRGLLREAVAVGRADGAALEDDDIEEVLTGTSQFGSRTGSSMLYDRLAGQPLEHEYLTGEVVRRGEAHGIATPLNAAMLALLRALDRGEPTAEPVAH